MEHAAQAQPTTTPSAAPRPAGDPHAALKVTFERLHAASRSDSYPSYERRIAHLDALLRVTLRHRTEIAEAISADFGSRSHYETHLGETMVMVSLIRYLKSNLRRFMKPRSRSVSFTFMPARAKIHYQPLGVVGVIAPWNYPYQLALTPAATALAAGNRVMIKPSEITPRTSELIARLMADTFDADTLAVVTGESDLGAAFSQLPFDHLFFTGSTAVGRLVMQAAAKNLTPVTLELGGKSPAILHESYPLAKSAERLASGKWFNGGQTCIAPDYVLAPRSQVEPLVEELRKVVTRSFPTLADNSDYCSIVSDRHYKRLTGLVAQAEGAGARKIELNPAGEALPPEGRKIAPTLLLDVDDSMAVMQEEIFGPVLPIVAYDKLEGAISYVNARPRPLALYYFDGDRERGRTVLQRTISGSAAINETVLQFAVEDLPFGGVGPSGIGAYHGPEGFETLSHKKGVFYQAKLNSAGLIAPPYGARLDKLLNFLLGKG